ncbi:MAG: peroxidase [Chloroflexi bacterium]|nr:peroxidase [Chloroflexota bacterium]
MAWIRMVEEDEATGYVREAYERSLARDQLGKGGVQEVLKVFSLRPDLMAARTGFGSAMTFGGSGLGRYREELIAVSISALLHCKY